MLAVRQVEISPQQTKSAAGSKPFEAGPGVARSGLSLMSGDETDVARAQAR